MRSGVLTVLLVSVVILSGIPVGASARAGAQRHDHKASPFDALRWEDDQPVVQIEAVWYRPRKIDSTPVTKILEACEERWPGQLHKRFGEDLMEAMALLGAEPGERVRLELVRVDDGQAVILEDVANTEERRRRIRNGQRPRLPQRPARLSLDAARADLETFEARLDARFAYLQLRPFDWRAELGAIREGLSDPVSVADLGTDLYRLMMRFGDGHADVTAGRSGVGDSGPFLPFLLEDSAQGTVAFTPDRSSFVDPERPFLVSIGGHSLEECLAAVRPYVVDGSPQVIRRRSLGLLRDASLWYPVLAGVEPPASLSVELRAADAAGAYALSAALTPAKPSYGDWPRTASRSIDGELGYLRLVQMDERAVEEVHERMADFRETRGLIVDVRGNGGGSRAALLALAGYLAGADRPWVGNVAAYRLAPGFDEDHLEARYMYRADHPGWSEAQRASIEALTFTPEWPLPEGFSERHYLVLDRTGHPGEYAYEQPVVVLSDAGCFSATDIFLAALELHPRVTLMGTPSGGGSARSQGFDLPQSGIQVRCASMASFRPDGRLYDGRGVEVDVELAPDAGYFLEGGRDVVLESAVDFLNRR